MQYNYRKKDGIRKARLFSCNYIFFIHLLPSYVGNGAPELVQGSMQ